MNFVTIFGLLFSTIEVPSCNLNFGFFVQAITVINFFFIYPLVLFIFLTESFIFNILLFYKKEVTFEVTSTMIVNPKMWMEKKIP